MQNVVGKVKSIKMKQTVVVQVDRLVAHPMYHKQMRRSTKYHAHMTNPVAAGDMVRIHQVRPISKTVHWQVEEVIKP